MTNIEVGEAFEILDRLPERLRRVALLRALGMRHKDIGELTGDRKSPRGGPSPRRLREERLEP